MEITDSSRHTSAQAAMLTAFNELCILASVIFRQRERKLGTIITIKTFLLISSCSTLHIIQIYFAVFFMRVKGARKQKSNNIEKMSTSLVCQLIVIAIIRELAKRVTRSKHMDYISVSDHLDARL